LIDFAGIAAGMQNSNYFVTDGGAPGADGIFEHLATPANLDFYLALQAHLAARRYSLSAPVGRWRRVALAPLAGKPAAVHLSAGRVHRSADAAHCRALGEMLANLHQAAADFPDRPCPTRAARLARASWRRLRRCCRPTSAVDCSRSSIFRPAGLFGTAARRHPCRPLSRQRAVGRRQLSGVLDFYFAGEDACFSIWRCRQRLVRRCAPAALLAGYEAVRPLTGRAWGLAGAAPCRGIALLAVAARSRGTIRGRGCGNDQESGAFRQACCSDFALLPEGTPPLASRYELKLTAISCGAGAVSGESREVDPGACFDWLRRAGAVSRQSRCVDRQHRAAAGHPDGDFHRAVLRPDSRPSCWLPILRGRHGEMCRRFSTGEAGDRRPFRRIPPQCRASWSWSASSLPPGSSALPSLPSCWSAAACWAASITGKVAGFGIALGGVMLAGIAGPGAVDSRSSWRPGLPRRWSSSMT
jgi:homoserine kinase type II